VVPREEQRAAAAAAAVEQPARAGRRLVQHLLLVAGIDRREIAASPTTTPEIAHRAPSGCPWS
jgi:hypothetical protein